MYEAIPDNLDYETVGKTNDIGYLAVATPGALKGWAHAVRHYGRLPWGRHIEPAIRHAASGFPASDYLIQNIATTRDALERFTAATRSSRWRRHHRAARTSRRSSTSSKASRSGREIYASASRATTTSSPRR
jgi:gamma-glutamyltranspeptidase